MTGAWWKGLLFSIHFRMRPKSHSVAESPLAAQGRPWVLSDSVSPGIALEVGKGLMSRENSHTQSYPENFLQNGSWVAFNWTIHLLALGKEMRPNFLVPDCTPWPLSFLSKEHGACHGRQQGTHQGPITFTLSEKCPKGLSALVWPFSQGLQTIDPWSSRIVSQSLGSPHSCLLEGWWELGGGRKWRKPV